MWSNSVWNLLLLALGVLFAGLIGLSFRGTDALLQLGQDTSDTVFGTSSYEGMVYYVDVEGNEYKLVGSDIEVFCEDVLEK